MAYVINPDGTVDVLEVEYDSYGNMRPKMKHDSDTPSFKSVSSIKSKISGFTSRKKKKKNKNTVVASSSVSPTDSSNNVKETVPSNNDSSKKGDNSLVKKVRIITRQSVEKFFLRKKSLRQIITNEELGRAKLLLKGLLLELFMQRYEQYKEYCLKMGWGQKIPIISKNKKKNKKKKKHIAATVIRHGNTSGNTIADIAKFSSVNDSLTNTDVIYNRRGPSRPPKYGYARDYFGRVQERDSFNDDRNNEFKQAERSQSRYDYSSYDAEDDHDSYYDSNGYE